MTKAENIASFSALTAIFAVTVCVIALPRLIDKVNKINVEIKNDVDEFRSLEMEIWYGY